MEIPFYLKILLSPLRLCDTKNSKLQQGRISKSFEMLSSISILGVYGGQLERLPRQIGKKKRLRAFEVADNEIKCVAG